MFKSAWTPAEALRRAFRAGKVLPPEKGRITAPAPVLGNGGSAKTRLENRCRDMGLCTIENRGGGHCLYYAVAHQLSCAGVGHLNMEELRTHLGGWLRENRDFKMNEMLPPCDDDLSAEAQAIKAGSVLKDFLDTEEHIHGGDGSFRLNDAFDGYTWEHFCDRVQDSSGAAWGNHLVLIAVCNFFDVQIRVTGSDSNGDHVLNNAGKRVIHLGHLGEYHWVSIVPQCMEIDSESDGVSNSSSSGPDLSGEEFPPLSAVSKLPAVSKRQTASSKERVMSSRQPTPSLPDRRRSRKFNSSSDEESPSSVSTSLPVC